MPPGVVKKIDIARCNQVALNMDAGENLVSKERVRPRDDKVLPKEVMLVAHAKNAGGCDRDTTETHGLIYGCELVQSSSKAF
jgi:hypothetical protein